MAERLQLLGAVEHEDVKHPGRLGRRHRGPDIYACRQRQCNVAAAAWSATTRVRPPAERTRLAGVAGLGGLPNGAPDGVGLRVAGDEEEHAPARSRAPAATSSRARRRARASASAGSARRSRSSRVGCPGKSEATWPSGPIPSRTRSRVAPASASSYSAAAASAPSSPRIRCASRGCRREVVEQLLAGEEVVRALVVRRDAALVAPPERGAAPVGLALGGELVGAARRLTAGEHDRLPGASRRDELVRDDRGGFLAHPPPARARRRGASRVALRQLLRPLHRGLDRVQERGPHACPLELADRPDRRPARRGDLLAQLDRVHASRRAAGARCRASSGRRVASRSRARARAGCRPRSSPRRAGRSTRGRSRRRP